jgi:general secretion pathway protein D
MKKAALVTVVLLGLWGCMTLASSYRLGVQAELNHDWDSAIAHYQRAALENPKEPMYRVALARAQVQASLAHMAAARILAAQDGKKAEAIEEYRKSLADDPRNNIAAAELQALTVEPAPSAPSEADLWEPPVKLAAGPEKLSLKFSEAQLKDIFQALGKQAGIGIVYDEQYKDIPLTVDLSGRTFEEAVNFLCTASHNFYRVIDPRTLIIAPDNAMKRLQYEINAIKVFYLSNVAAPDVQNSLLAMLRTSYKTPNIIADKTLNSLTIRDTPAVIQLAEKLIRAWDKAKPEVLVDLEVLEVSRNNLNKLGIELAQGYGTLRYNEADASAESSGYTKLQDFKPFQRGNLDISVPAALLQVLETDADTKIIAQTRLRGVAEEDMSNVVGQKVPIIKTTFQPIAAGGVSSEPLTNYDYQDVGLDIKIKPHIHAEREVTLELDLKITSLAGTGYADIPIINTREVKNTLRLRDGESNLLAGLLRDEERTSLKGIPYLVKIPVLGRLFGSSTTTVDQTDVVLTITPHIIRAIPLGDEDRKPLWVDIESLGGGGEGEFAPEEYAPEEMPGRPRQPGAPTPEEEAQSGQNQIFLNPPNFEVPQKREFRISVNLMAENEVGTLAVNIGYDQTIVTLKSVEQGGLVTQLGQKTPFLSNFDNDSGTCTLGLSSSDPARGVRGAGTVAVLVFEGVAAGEAVVSVTGVTASGPNGKPVIFDTQDAQIVVR